MNELAHGGLVASGRDGLDIESRNYVKRAEAAAKVAADFSDQVDREGRFPREAFEALRRERLLGMLIPTRLGGDGSRAIDVANVCAILGSACGSTALIFAMHQVSVACLVRHDCGNAWQEQFQSDVALNQWLLASSTTEGNDGGNVRSSEAAIEIDERHVRLTRDASVISYGAQADAILTTARRSTVASNSDQVLIVLRRSDYTLEQTKTWNTLGMRGTCSVGYMLRAVADVDQVLSEPYARVHSQTMVPCAHLFWSSTWQGIAAAAFGRARAFVRQSARVSGGRMPPGAPHLTRARVTLETLRGVVQSGLSSFERSAALPGGLTGIDSHLALNFLKVEASELAVATVMSSMWACGLSGYRNDAEFSMGRHLRDILSAPIMINNDRILANSEAAVLMSEPPVWLAN